MKWLRIFGIATMAAALPAWSGSAESLDLGKLTCKELMAGNDQDRDAGISWFHGYFAGKKGELVLDVEATTGLTQKVIDYCLSNPTSTVMNAFSSQMK